MKKMTALFLTLTFLLPGLALCGGTPSPEEILAGMTTEQKVAQVLMPAFYYRMDEEGKRVGVAQIYPEMEEMLRKYGFGGVIFNPIGTSIIQSAPKSTRLSDRGRSSERMGTPLQRAPSPRRAVSIWSE